MKDLNGIRDARALKWMGNAFIKIPWTIVKQIFGNGEEERLTGILHLALICLCYHTDGYVAVRKEKIPCARGEYVGSYRKLSRKTGISFGTVSRLLEKLESRGLVEISLVKGGSRVRVCGYSQFMLNPEATKEEVKAKTPEEAHAEEVKKLRKEPVSDASNEINFF